MTITDCLDKLVQVKTRSAAATVLKCLLRDHDFDVDMEVFR